MRERMNMSDGLSASVLMRTDINELIRLAATYHVRHYRPSKSGRMRLLHEQLAKNLVVYEGKNKVIDTALRNQTQVATWYMGLKGTGSAVNGDTLASHAGWSEINPYSGNRPAITWGAPSNGSTTGTAVQFTITSGTTVYGAFFCSVNTGTSGTLLSASDFGASRVVAINDVLSVTPTMNT